MSMLERGGNGWIILWVLNCLGGVGSINCSCKEFNAFVNEIIHHSYIDKKFDKNKYIYRII